MTRVISPWTLATRLTIGSRKIGSMGWCPMRKVPPFIKLPLRVTQGYVYPPVLARMGFQRLCGSMALIGPVMVWQRWRKAVGWYCRRRHPDDEQASRAIRKPAFTSGLRQSGLLQPITSGGFTVRQVRAQGQPRAFVGVPIG